MKKDILFLLLLVSCLASSSQHVLERWKSPNEIKDEQISAAAMRNDHYLAYYASVAGSAGGGLCEPSNEKAMVCPNCGQKVVPPRL